MICVIPAQCLGYTAKKLLACNTGFSCYSTVWWWEYVKCRSGLKMQCQISSSFFIILIYFFHYIYNIETCGYSNQQWKGSCEGTWRLRSQTTPRFIKWVIYCS